MFAPSFHPAMKYAGPSRKEIGIRTVFNILGPLTNPAGAIDYLLGVADGSLVETLAKVLQSLGCRHALVVHGEDGLDEITLTGKTQVCEVTGNGLKSYTIYPEELGLARTEPGNLKGGTAAENAEMLREILSGKTGARRDIVVVNAAAALTAGNLVKTIKQGINLAEESIDSGKAKEKLESLVRLTGSFN
jgi:anthranilate phosphoribosyltransferase